MSRYFDLCCWPSTPSNILRLRIGSQCNATSNLRNKWKYDIVKNDSEILDISSIWWRSNHSGPRGSKIFEKYLHCLNHPYTQPQTKASSNLMKQIKSILKWQESGGGLMISQEMQSKSHFLPPHFWAILQCWDISLLLCWDLISQGSDSPRQLLDHLLQTEPLFSFVRQQPLPLSTWNI